MRKSIIVLLILSIFFICIPTYSKALTLTEIFDSGDRFLGEASGTALFDEDSETEAINTIYWLALGIAVIAAVIIGMVIGIQFITSGASGQAKVKEKLIPFCVGCVVAFGAFGIWKFTLNILNSTFPDESSSYTSTQPDSSGGSSHQSSGSGSHGGGGQHR